jgi:hypothetical protein
VQTLSTVCVLDYEPVSPNDAYVLTSAASEIVDALEFPMIYRTYVISSCVIFFIYLINVSYGRRMRTALAGIGVHLPGVLAAPEPADLEARFLGAGFEAASAHTLRGIYEVTLQRYIICMISYGVSSCVVS